MYIGNMIKGLVLSNESPAAIRCGLYRPGGVEGEKSANLLARAGPDDRQVECARTFLTSTSTTVSLADRDAPETRTVWMITPSVNGTVSGCTSSLAESSWPRGRESAVQSPILEHEEFSCRPSPHAGSQRSAETGCEDAIWAEERV